MSREKISFIDKLFPFLKKRGEEAADLTKKVETNPAIVFHRTPAQHVLNASKYTDFVYAKSEGRERIKEYWDMFFDPNINDAITDILDSMIYEEDGRFFSLIVKREGLTELLQEEFDKLFDTNLQLQDYLQLYDIALEWMVEGRLAVQLLYNPQLLEQGILGINTIPYYTLKEVHKKDESGQDTYEIEKYVVEVDDKTYELSPFEIILFDVGLKLGDTYYSYLEIAKIPWRKLSLMEDAAVVNKLIRAPMRRVFYIRVGEMPPPEAEEYIKEIQQTLHQEIKVNSIGELYNKMNPLTLLDDYYIPVDAEGSELMKIENLEGTTTWDAMDELRYFTFQLYKALRIPKARMNILGNEENSGLVLVGSKLGEITKDEFKFARFIQRLQGRFARGLLEELFWRHLVLRGLVEKYNLRRGDFAIQMTRPTYFDELKQQEVIEARINNYTSLLQDDALNKRWLLKKYLKLTDEEIKEALSKEESEEQEESPF